MSKYVAFALRTCKSDMTAHGGFKWPKRGRVEAPDWNPELICGYGLHGLLHGVGNASDLYVHDEDESQLNYLVVGLTQDDFDAVVDLNGKVKFPGCNVLFVGSRDDAVKYIQKKNAKEYPVVYGTATAGDDGTATAGDDGTATAGNRGTATAGNRGTATAGWRGTATAGRGGALIIEYWCEEESLYKKKIALVGENSILADTPYRLDKNKEFMVAESDEKASE